MKHLLTFIALLGTLGANAHTYTDIDFKSHIKPKKKETKPPSVRYMYVSFVGNSGLTSEQEMAPVTAELSFVKRMHSSNYSSLGSQSELSFSYFTDYREFIIPTAEYKIGPVWYFSPERNNSTYIGGGIGLGLPRIFPIYISLGRELHRFGSHNKNYELQISSMVVPGYPEITKTMATAKVSYGFGY